MAPYPHVLALDDDADIRRVLAEYLSGHDLRVTAVATGGEMLELFENEPIDVLLLDLHLPGEDGLALARKVRELSRVPIIILSGRTDEADRVMGLELAADDYVTKPFSPRELLARIRAVLRRAHNGANEEPRDRWRARIPVRQLGAQRPVAPTRRPGWTASGADQQ